MFISNTTMVEYDCPRMVGFLSLRRRAKARNPPMLGLEFRGNELTFPKAGFDANTAEPVDLLESWLNSGAQAEL